MVTRMAENSFASIIGSLEPFDPEIDNWPAYIERLEQFFKPVVCGWFLEIALVRTVSVCPPLRELITSGVIWCDIDRVRLIKQVHGFSLLFNFAENLGPPELKFLNYLDHLEVFYPLLICIKCSVQRGIIYFT